MVDMPMANDGLSNVPILETDAAELMIRCMVHLPFSLAQNNAQMSKMSKVLFFSSNYINAMLCDMYGVVHVNIKYVLSYVDESQCAHVFQTNDDDDDDDTQL